MFYIDLGTGRNYQKTEHLGNFPRRRVRGEKMAPKSCQCLSRCCSLTCVLKHCFLLIVASCTAVGGYFMYSFFTFGPADKLQLAAYFVLFITAAGIIFTSLAVYFILLKLPPMEHWSLLVVHAAFTALLFLSLICSMIFAMNPNENSVRQFFQNFLRSSGKPSKFVDILQKHGNCCGIRGFQDYNISGNATFLLPASCCKTSKSECLPGSPEQKKLGCFERTTTGEYVWSANNPESLRRVNSIILSPILLNIMTVFDIFLFTYFHCWLSIFDITPPPTNEPEAGQSSGKRDEQHGQQLHPPGAGEMHPEPQKTLSAISRGLNLVVERSRSLTKSMLGYKKAT